RRAVGVLPENIAVAIAVEVGLWQFNPEHLRLHGQAVGVSARSADAMARVLPRHDEAAVRQRRDLVVALFAGGRAVDEDLAPLPGAAGREYLRLDGIAAGIPARPADALALVVPR